MNQFKFSYLLNMNLYRILPFKDWFVQPERSYKASYKGSCIFDFRFFFSKKSCILPLLSSQLSRMYILYLGFFISTYLLTSVDRKRSWGFKIQPDFFCLSVLFLNCVHFIWFDAKNIHSPCEMTFPTMEPNHFCTLELPLSKADFNFWY